MSEIAPIVPFIPLIAAGMTTVGGLVTGLKGAKQNEQMIAGQNQQLAQVQQFAQRLAGSVTRAEYDQQANKDVNAAMGDVFNAMAQRGMGRSTAALTASSATSGQIRSTYSKQYLSDRLSSLQTAGGMISGVANTPRMGFDANPFAGLQSGLSGIANGAAYYQKNKPGDVAGTPSTPYSGYSVPGYGTGTGLSTTPIGSRYYGPSLGQQYN